MTKASSLIVERRARRGSVGRTLGVSLLAVGISLAAAELLLWAASLAVSDRAGEARAGAPHTIVCVGDSHTFGAGVAQSESYPFHLQTLLDEHARGKYSVINLGIPGMNTTQVANRLPAYVSRFEPDAVIVWVGVNNAWNWSEVEDAPATWRAYLDGFASHSRLYRFTRVFLHDRQLRREWESQSTLDRRFAERAFELDDTHGHDSYQVGIGGRREAIQPDRRENTTRLDDAAVRRAERDYRVMAEFARGAGVRLIFVTYPLELRSFADANRAMRKVARKYGLSLVESVDSLKRVPIEGQKWDKTLHPQGPIYEEIARDLVSIVADGRTEAPAAPGRGFSWNPWLIWSGAPGGTGFSDAREARRQPWIDTRFSPASTSDGVLMGHQATATVAARAAAGSTTFEVSAEARRFFCRDDESYAVDDSGETASSILGAGRDRRQSIVVHARSSDRYYLLHAISFAGCAGRPLAVELSDGLPADLEAGDEVRLLYEDQSLHPNEFYYSAYWQAVLELPWEFVADAVSSRAELLPSGRFDAGCAPWTASSGSLEHRPYTGRAGDGNRGVVGGGCRNEGRAPGGRVESPAFEVTPMQWTTVSCFVGHDAPVAISIVDAASGQATDALTSETVQIHVFDGEYQGPFAAREPIPIGMRSMTPVAVKFRSAASRVRLVIRGSGSGDLALDECFARPSVVKSGALNRVIPSAAVRLFLLTDSRGAKGHGNASGVGLDRAIRALEARNRGFREATGETFAVDDGPHVYARGFLSILGASEDGILCQAPSGDGSGCYRFEQSKPDTVFIALGINDALLERDVAETVDQLRRVVERAANAGAIPIVLFEYPYFGDTPYEARCGEGDVPMTCARWVNKLLDIWLARRGSGDPTA